MANYDLYDTIGDYSAANNAKTYFEEAFSFASNHNISVDISYDVKYAPSEVVLEPVAACDPCSDSRGTGCNETTFDNLGEWWHDELYCDESGQNGYDCQLLLTDYQSQAGIAINSWAAVSEGGPRIADLPDYRYLAEESDDSANNTFNSMQTAYHEAGHCFLEGGEDNFDEHNVGNTLDYYGNRGGTFRTPFHDPCGNYYGNDECGDDVSCEDDSNDWVMGYGSCCKSKMGEYE